MASRRWQIWVDTGGTFTDAVGVGPDGDVRAVKVLTSGCLRGRVRTQLNPTQLHVESVGMEAVSPDLAASMVFVVHRGGDAGDADTVRIPVARYEPNKHLLTLARPLPEPLEPGTTFEWVSGEEAPVLAARMLTGAAVGTPLPVDTLRLASTLGTNALLERRGAEVAFFVNEGFEDLLLIGTQQRPDLFSLRIEKPAPLYRHVVGVPGRLGPDGTEVEPLAPDAVEARARALATAGCTAAAVALLHSDRNPAHERALERRLREWGFQHVSCSHALVPFVKIHPRAETAVVNATLAPILSSYLERIRSALGEGRLYVMTSAGGLVGPERFAPKDGLLSGPAGGVVGASWAAREAGAPRAIAFDMGGTSTDVSRVDETGYEYVFEHRVGDAHLMAPALAVESVAAGGGSICRFDGHRLQVGPRSAGAVPGPACYGAGGPLTLTDVNLLLGRIEPSRFPFPLDLSAARRRADELAAAVAAVSAEAPSPEVLLHGFLDIADERMADAIRRISVRKGFDPTRYHLVAFGGAGPQHACGVARKLGIRDVVVPRAAGLLSALGVGRAAIERFVERQVLEPLDDVLPSLPTRLETLEAEARAAVAEEGIPPAEIFVARRIAHLRLQGQETALEVEVGDPLGLPEAFATRYQAQYGYAPEDRGVELVSLRVVARSIPPPFAWSEPQRPEGRRLENIAPLWHDGRWVPVPRVAREFLAPGKTLEGPALVVEAHTCTFVDAGWSARVHPSGTLMLRWEGPSEPAGGAGDAAAERPEVVELELFTHRFEQIAREMGEQLERTAVSTNVKERLDFSCALLDPEGRLVVNAPHIPIHLGSMGLCVRAVMKALPMEAGDVVVTNHPAYGGSHLPDVTVITPVYADRDGSRRLAEPAHVGFVASRAHHAEIGGTWPGSMPPDARSLHEEGASIPPTYLVRRHQVRWEGIRHLLTCGPYPTRALEDNLADLRAAIAANQVGALALRALARAHGIGTVLRYMESLKRLAEVEIRHALRAIPEGVYEAQERLDDGWPLRARLEIREDTMTVDFRGSGGVHPANLNATQAIVRGVVIYVLRVLAGRDLPLNEGLMRPVELILEPGILDPPFAADPAASPAVVGGNVETSQRLVDTVLKALELAACSQGTMNNVVFGNETFGYYETVAGGAGAGPGFHGADAVHTHMTNTRITDAEILERRYPVRLRRFAVRRGSGGTGAFRGGDGVIREYVFLEPMRVSLLTQHRVEAPYGLQGGGPGARGEQRILRAGGGEEVLEPVDGRRVEPGDRLVLWTPGGGGFGSPPADPSARESRGGGSR